MDYLNKVEKIVHNTLHTYYKAVKRLYVKNEVQLNWENIKDNIGNASGIKSNPDIPYTREQIKSILEKCDERERVIVLLLASTGMRRGAMAELKHGDLRYIEQYGIYEIKVYAGQTDLIKDRETGKVIGEKRKMDPEHTYLTYCSSECANAIRSYLDFRKRNGENITDDSYLIRKQFNGQHRSEYLKKKSQNVPDRLKTISLPTDPPYLHKVTEHNIEYTIYQLVCDAGIRDLENKKTKLGDRHKIMVEHGFRKYHMNKCLESGIYPMYVEFLQGRDIGVARHYYRPGSIEGKYSLLELYVQKAMPELVVSDEVRTKLKMTELEAKMQEEQERVKRAFEETQKALEEERRKREEQESE
ncbi:MAG TPA: hypothetical protein VFS97_03975 [Nitrososphaeraceae archaeon]|nr:hypothetical protein [Nitrososphaeraceae archaeon]